MQTMNKSHGNAPRQISHRKAAQFWRATLNRDARADGTFVLAVRSTHIYCRPSCPARRPLRRNAIFFRTREEAEKQGFRPCLRCRPNEIAASASLVARAAKILGQSSEEGMRLSALAMELGSNATTLRRAFRQVTGLAPRELAEAIRVMRFKSLLRAGKNITDALYETGYGSSSRVYERSNAQLGMTPATYQKGGKGMKIEYTIAQSPLGKVLVAATERGVSAVYLGDAQNKLVAELRDEYPRAEISPATDGSAAMGPRNCPAHRWQARSSGSSARLASHGISAARVAGTAAHSARKDAHVLASGPRARTSKGRSGGGPGLRHQSRFDRGAMPPRNSRRWQPGRLSLGAGAQRAVAGHGARRSELIEAHPMDSLVVIQAFKKTVISKRLARFADRFEPIVSQNQGLS